MLLEVLHCRLGVAVGVTLCLASVILIRARIRNCWEKIPVWKMASTITGIPDFLRLKRIPKEFPEYGGALSLGHSDLA